MDDSSPLVVIKEVMSLLDQVWTTSETQIPDEMHKRLTQVTLDQVAMLLRNIGEKIGNLESMLEARTKQGQKAAAAVARYKHEMQHWRESHDKYVRSLVNEVTDEVLEENREATEWKTMMNIEQKLAMVIYETLADDSSDYWTAQQLAANAAGWLTHYEALGEEITNEQRDALRRLAEAVNGVWLEEVPDDK